MAQHPDDERDSTGKLKTKYVFSGEVGTYIIWTYDIRAYLYGNGVEHHLFVSDAEPCPGNGKLLDRRKANRAAVHAYLNSCV